MRSAHPDWIKELQKKAQIDWDRVTKSALFTEITEARLPVPSVGFAIKNFYPLIELFPQYLAQMLSRVPSGSAKKNVLARQWLTENLNVEQAHANWFIDLGVGFGVAKNSFEHPISPPPEMEAINNYLWHICAQGSLAECFSAVNFAMEGPTGEWTKMTREGFLQYKNQDGTSFGNDTMRWIDAHAIYDDEHVEGALHLMALFARTKNEQEKSAAAAIRALKYYAMAVEACYLLAKQQSA